jgi:hypothetical protein
MTEKLPCQEAAKLTVCIPLPFGATLAAKMYSFVFEENSTL